MNLPARLLAALLLGVAALAAHAQPAATDAPRKVAITSLVGDTLAIATYRPQAGTNLQSNYVEALKMPGPALDHAVLKAVDDGLRRRQPAPSVALLRVPVAGSVGDPARLFADGQLVPGHTLPAALREQGFTHLVAVTRHRSRNNIRLDSGVAVGGGLLEGLGFYLDNDLVTGRADKAEAARGFVAPYLYVQLALVDLQAGRVVATQAITADVAASAAENPAGLSAWGAMTPERKLQALNYLIEWHVPGAAERLLAGS